MSEPKQAPLAVRREALVRQCAEQRDQLALLVHSVRTPLDGGPVGRVRSSLDTVRGWAANVLNSPLRLKLGVPLALAAAAGGVAAVRRKRAGRAAHAAAPHGSAVVPLLTRGLALWNTVQPLLPHVRAFLKR